MSKAHSVNGWTTEKLENLVSFKTGKLNANAATPDGEYPFFTCSPETLRTDTYSFDTECVLLAGNNANGVFPIKYYSGKFDAYQRTYVIRTLDDSVLSNRYLYYALQPKLELMQSLSTGATTKFLPLTILNGIELDVPPLATQHKIAGILSAYDDLIENNTQRIEILEEMAQAIYREWFVHFRFLGHEDVEMVESELGPVPAGWEVVELREMYDTSSGGTPRRSIENYFGGGIDWLKTGELNDSYVLETEETLSQEGLDNSSAKLFPENTVLMAMYGATTGKLGILAMPAATNQACCAILKMEEPFGHAFAYLHLLENRESLVSLQMGAAQQNLSQKVIKAFKLLKPNSEVVSQFNEVVEPILTEIKLLRRKNILLGRTRDLLLPRLISGEIDVNDLGVEAPYSYPVEVRLLTTTEG